MAMDHLDPIRFARGMKKHLTQPIRQATLFSPDYLDVRRAIAKRSFATVASCSSAGRPHAVGVIYADVDGVLYISTDRSSRKARNIRANPDVFVSIAVRRIPVGAPPSSIQFRGTAEILAVGHPDVVELGRAGALKAIASHGELERPDICLLRVTPGRTIHTYGLGMSLRALAKDPLNAAGEVTNPASLFRSGPTTGPTRDSTLESTRDSTCASTCGSAMVLR